MKQLLLIVFILFIVQVYPVFGYDMDNKNFNDKTPKISKVEYRLIKDIQTSILQAQNIKIPIAVKYLNGSYEKKFLTFDEIIKLASDRSVEYIRYPRKAQLLDSGVLNYYNVDIFHKAGFKGQNVKVAIIDIGFKDYELLNAERIIEMKSFRDDNKIDSTVHGTLCAQIISDIAPEAELYLLAIQTDLDFVEAVNYAISKNVDVISVSLGFLAAPFDGTGLLCDAVNKAAERGIAVVVSAGNFADKHYEGFYKDPDDDGWHNFGKWDEILDLGYLNAGEKVELTLNWDDWPASSNDYDLFLLYKNDSKWEIYSYSTTPQTGYEEPVEIIEEVVPFDAEWGIAVKKSQNAKPLKLEIYSNIRLEEYLVENSSLSSPADAGKAISVGAVSLPEYQIFEFSSRGPTNDGRIKPDFVSMGNANIFSYLLLELVFQHLIWRV